MAIDKKIVRARFNAASGSYDSVASVQRSSAELLIAHLHDFNPKFVPMTILDLGSGTGYTTELLRKYYPNARYTLSDIALNMLMRAKRKFGQNEQFSFCVNDMEDNTIGPHDMTVSNLALQWAKDLEQTITTLQAQSKVFAFSCLTQGTFEEWERLLISHGLPSTVRKYPTQNYLSDFIASFKGSRHSFQLAEIQFRCNGALGFMRYMQDLGSSAGAIQIAPKKIAHLIKACSQEFLVTYKIFFSLIEQR